MKDNNQKKTAKLSNRYPFITEHRGGPLSKENHRKLIKWAKECSEHVLSLVDEEIDKRLIHALDVADEWANDKVVTGVAMKASLGAHAVARQKSVSSESKDIKDIQSKSKNLKLIINEWLKATKLESRTL